MINFSARSEDYVTTNNFDYNKLTIIEKQNPKSQLNSNIL